MAKIKFELPESLKRRIKAQALFEADFVLVSHGTEADPIYSYANYKALQLWQLNWEDFTSMPSRKSA
ncbi:MAG: MEKHLA domain-containing protein, partial [Cyanobacteria bacterium J06629_2]